MQTLQYNFADKTEWGDGPWQSEPDKKQWTDEATGLPCLIVRNRMGGLCGYVGVSASHPLFQKEYEDCDVSVHGGVTFTDFCAEGDPEHGICHRVETGEDDHVWWLGFDCAHLGDLVPGMLAFERKHMPELARFKPDGDTYKDVSYVERECADLAKQLVEKQNGGCNSKAAADHLVDKHQE